jgi:hypothetical protein
MLEVIFVRGNPAYNRDFNKSRKENSYRENIKEKPSCLQHTSTY